MNNLGENQRWDKIQEFVTTCKKCMFGCDEMQTGWDNMQGMGRKIQFIVDDYPQRVQLQGIYQLQGLTSFGEPKNK